MGAFDFFKKILGGTDKQNKQGIGVKLKTSVSVERVTSERKPNPAYKKARFEKNELICVEHLVKGKNPNTGRTKTEKVLGIRGESREDIIKRTYLQEPIEITEVEQRQPSEAQIEYAKNLGITFPVDATMEDASVILTRAEDGVSIMQDKLSNELIKIAVFNLGIFIPAYAGYREFERMFYNSLDTKGECAYFAMRVYCEKYGKKYTFPYEATEEERKKFNDFAEQQLKNRSFVESYERYNLEEMPIGGIIKKRLKAYDIAYECL